MTSNDSPPAPELHIVLTRHTRSHAQDRLNNPTSFGYKDFLLNVRCKNGNHVGELQLHLAAIHAIKPMCHRTYRLLRQVGWEDFEIENKAAHIIQVGRSRSQMVLFCSRSKKKCLCASFNQQAGFFLRGGGLIELIGPVDPNDANDGFVKHMQKRGCVR